MAQRKHRLQWDYEQRLRTEHFGLRKYPTSGRALGELVANGFDAGATRVSVEVKLNELGGPESIAVDDDGKGISPAAMQERFMRVAVSGLAPSASVRPFSRFGIGRFAASRIGTMSKWSSVSEGTACTRTRLSFVLEDSVAEDLEVLEEHVPADCSPGTRVEIFNLRDTQAAAPTPVRMSQELAHQFFSFLLANPQKTISVNGEGIDAEGMVLEREREDLEEDPTFKSATLTHHLLNQAVTTTRFPEHLIFAAQGRTVATAQPEDVDPNYLGVVQSPYLDEIVGSNRADLVDLDGGYASLREAALDRADAYVRRKREDRKRQFIERARGEEFYPFKDASGGPIEQLNQAVYDVALERVHENVNLDRMSRKQKAVVFRLLKRALDDENLLDILREIADLSDEEVRVFKEVLERTTLASIVKLSSEVTKRLGFLDALHELVYGDESQHVRERSQLHKFLEPDCWIFGSQYHLAASDQSFRTIVRRHRRIAGLTDPDEVDISTTAGIDQIPDLFLAATREYPDVPKNRHLLVEIKAPRVKLGSDEENQIRKYAETILDSGQFDTVSTHWDVYLVSTEMTDRTDRNRRQRDRPIGQVYTWDDMSVWAFTWAELIAGAREEMRLVREHLDRKSADLGIPDYLRERFPDVVSSDGITV